MAEEQAETTERQNEFLFMQIVMMFHGAAMQNMGKLMNPVTQKVERDLGQAKNAIDILGMLEAKTRGNLSPPEKQMLEHTLFELRLNYVDEVKKDNKVGADEAEAGGEASGASEEKSGETESSESSESEESA